MHAALGSTLKPHKPSACFPSVVKGEVGDQKCNIILSSEVNLRPARATMTPCFRKRNNIKETNFHIIQVANFPCCNKFLGIELRRGFASRSQFQMSQSTRSPTYGEADTMAGGGAQQSCSPGGSWEIKRQEGAGSGPLPI